MPAKGDKTGIYIICEFCGKEVYKTLSQYNKREHHFCSNECQAKMRRVETYEHRSCETCGNDMYVRKKSKQRFCSNKCQSIWQTSRTGELNPKFDRVDAICDNCGCKYLIQKYKASQQTRHFCCVDCRRAWYRETWSQQPQWKEASRERAANLLKDNSITNTKPQIIMNDILRNNNIVYENERVFGFYAIDNYLVDSNLAIEVMGDYWHCNRMVYNEIRYKTQAEAIRRDKSKRTYMMQHHGIAVLYIWEYDLNNRRQVVEKLVNEYIVSGGYLQDYHSLNYEICNGGLVIIEDKIIPYQDMDIETQRQYIKITG